MTSWSGFARARARASWGLLLTLLVLVMVTTAIIAGTLGYSQAAASTSAQQALTQGEPTESGVQVQTRLAPDPTLQDELAREVIVAAFAPAPVSIGRLVVSEPLPVHRAGTTLEGRLVVSGGPDLAPSSSPPAGLVTVVEGTWPDVSTGDEDGPSPAALHAGAAAAWGVEVGDVLAIDGDGGGVAIEVTGTWQPVDPQDAFWFGDELIRTGVLDEGGTVGPLITDVDLVSSLGDPFVRWPVRPEAAAVTPDDLGVLAAGAENLRSALRDVEGLTVRGVQVEGDLAPTAAQASDNLATSRALGLVPLSVLILVTGLSVAQLARLLADTREPQAALLVARGASRGQVLRVSLSESIVVALIGAALGTTGAWAVLQPVPGSEGSGFRILSAGALTLLGIVLALAAVCALQARRLSAGTAVAARSGRARAAAAVATVLLVLGAAALSWWQLRRAGSPLTRETDGTLGTDVVAGAAPALLLAAAAVIAMALLGPLSRVIELGTRPSRGLGAHLASAQVSRHVPVYAVPVVLTVLAVGSTTLAGLYAGTSTQLRDDLGDVSEGAPLRADLIRPTATVAPGVVPAPPPDLAALPEIGAAALVWTEPSTRIGGVDVPLMLADTDDLAEVANVPAGYPQGLVPPGLSQVRDTQGNPVDRPVIDIPAGVEELSLDLTIERSVNRWEIARLDSIVDSERQLEELLEATGATGPAGPDPGGEAQRPGSLEERVTASLDLEVEAAAAPREVVVTLTVQDVRTGLTTSVRGAPVDAAGPELSYDPQTLSDVAVVPQSTEGSVSFELPSGRDHEILALTVEPPVAPAQSRPLSVAPEPSMSVGIDLSLRAEGQDLLSQAGSWGSETAATPAGAAPLLAEAEAIDPAVERTVFEVDQSFVGDDVPPVFALLDSNRVPVPPILDTGAPTWRLDIVATSTDTEEILVAPGLTFQDILLGAAPPSEPAGDPPGTEGEASAPGGASTVPVALSEQAATAASLEVDDPMTLSISGTTVPARVAAVVSGLPGQRGPTAALADSRAVTQVLAQQQRTLNWPTQAWARPADTVAPGAASAALGERADLRAVTGSTGISATDATSSARLVFWVASAGAVLLALTGISAVAATLLTARRADVAVLRALGMPSATQARSRALELVGVVAAAVLFGLIAGWVVGQAVVPELASSTIPPGRLQLPAVLRMETTPWLGLLMAGLLGVGALASTLANRVRAQALDRDYREEIR